ncbi:MAG: lactoylglutathione lyase [Sphingomonadaceae bacterium]|nr:lactoylglutathione lyase [Sphingomonadaceae bacterium]
MTQMIFVNLPVTDLKASMAFYEAAGFANNPQFTDETAACMMLSEEICVMLLTHDKWRVFTDRPIADAHKSGEVMLAISCDGRDAVDAMTETAGKNGGTADINAKQDYGWMYSRSFADPDGHVWETMWMDMAAMEAAEGSEQPAAA